MATSRTIDRQKAGMAEVTLPNRQLGRIALTIGANIALFMLLFQLYKMVRKTFIQRGEVVGFQNAERIIDLEKWLQIFAEPRLQAWVIGHEWLIRGLNWYYAGFMWAFYGCCVVAMAFAPHRYAFLRRAFLLSMLLALPWYAIFPLAPPRFMPQYGFIDTLKVYGPDYFGGGGMVTANQYAAMPSMHIGWTTIGAMMLAVAIPYRRIGLTLGVTHLLLMTLAVTATANHFILDAIGGWLIVAAALIAARLLPTPLNVTWRRQNTGGSVPSVDGAKTGVAHNNKRIQRSN
jgi:PAP2 superfamily